MTDTRKQCLSRRSPSIGVAKRLDDDFIGGRETLAIGELMAVVDDGDVEPEHRAHRGERLRDMPGAHDNEALGPRNRIDEDTRRAVRFDSRSMAQSGLADLDQSRMRIGGALGDLVERESLEAYWRQSGGIVLSGIDDGARSNPGSSRAGIDNRQQRGRMAAFRSVCELSRQREIGVGRPSVDENIHDAAAGADFLLVEIARQVHFGKARLTSIFK